MIEAVVLLAVFTGTWVGLTIGLRNGSIDRAEARIMRPKYKLIRQVAFGFMMALATLSVVAWLYTVVA